MVLLNRFSTLLISGGGLWARKLSQQYALFTVTPISVNLCTLLCSDVNVCQDSEFFIIIWSAVLQQTSKQRWVFFKHRHRSIYQNRLITTQEHCALTYRFIVVPISVLCTWFLFRPSDFLYVLYVLCAVLWRNEWIIIISKYHFHWTAPVPPVPRWSQKWGTLSPTPSGCAAHA